MTKRTALAKAYGACLVCLVAACKGDPVGLASPDASATHRGGGGETSGTGGATSSGGAAGEGTEPNAGGSTSETGGGSSTGSGGASAGGTTGSGGVTGGGNGGNGGSGGAPVDVCEDGMVGPAETDADCGGSCPPCTLGDTCNYDADCESQSCAYGLCEPHLYLASKSEEGDGANGSSRRPVLSEDGSVVAYETIATNLFGDDQTGGIVIHDRISGTAERATLGYAGKAAAGSDVAISRDGQVVAFLSGDGELVENDTNNRDDIFVYDRKDGSLERANVSSSGEQVDSYSFGSSLSADGNLVLFVSEATNLDGDSGIRGAFVRNRSAGTTTRVSLNASGEEADSSSFHARITPDGSQIVFASLASNLVAGDENGVADVYRKRLDSGQVFRISRDTGLGEPNAASSEPAISASGFNVVFVSEADNLVEGDTNGFRDCFYFGGSTSTITRINVSSEGEQADGHCVAPDISDDGRYVVFYTNATNLSPAQTTAFRAYVHDVTTHRTEQISTTVDGEFTLDLNQNPRISGDGGFIVVESYEDNLFIGTYVPPIAAVFANPLRPF